MSEVHDPYDNEEPTNIYARKAREREDKLRKYLSSLKRPEVLEEVEKILQAAEADPIEAGGSMPLTDNGESLNISGEITAISVNNFQRHDPLPPDANGNPIVSVKMGHRLTVTIDTFDVETVRKLMLIRSRQPAHHGKVTADLIVWPLQ